MERIRRATAEGLAHPWASTDTPTRIAGLEKKRPGDQSSGAQVHQNSFDRVMP